MNHFEVLHSNQLERNLESELILTGVRILELNHVALRFGVITGEAGDSPEVTSGKMELDVIHAPFVHERFREAVGERKVLETDE